MRRRSTVTTRPGSVRPHESQVPSVDWPWGPRVARTGAPRQSNSMFGKWRRCRWTFRAWCGRRSDVRGDGNGELRLGVRQPSDLATSRPGIGIEAECGKPPSEDPVTTFHLNLPPKRSCVGVTSHPGYCNVGLDSVSGETPVATAVDVATGAPTRPGQQPGPLAVLVTASATFLRARATLRLFVPVVVPLIVAISS